MKLRKPLVLRFHKFKKSSQPHDFYYSEQLLYYPHTSNEDLFPNDLEMCKQNYFERLGEIEQNGERFKSESEEPPVKVCSMCCLKFLSLSLKIIHSCICLRSFWVWKELFHALKVPIIARIIGRTLIFFRINVFLEWALELVCAASGGPKKNVGR